jgi:hypothetical protein
MPRISVSLSVDGQRDEPVRSYTGDQARTQRNHLTARQPARPSGRRDRILNDTGDATQTTVIVPSKGHLRSGWNAPPARTQYLMADGSGVLVRGEPPLLDPNIKPDRHDLDRSWHVVVSVRFCVSKCSVVGLAGACSQLHQRARPIRAASRSSTSPLRRLRRCVWRGTRGPLGWLRSLQRRSGFALRPVWFAAARVPSSDMNFRRQCRRTLGHAQTIPQHHRDSVPMAVATGSPLRPMVKSWRYYDTQSLTKFDPSPRREPTRLTYTGKHFNSPNVLRFAATEHLLSILRYQLGCRTSETALPACTGHRPPAKCRCRRQAAAAQRRDAGGRGTLYVSCAKRDRHTGGADGSTGAPPCSPRRPTA